MLQLRLFQTLGLLQAVQDPIHLSPAVTLDHESHVFDFLDAVLDPVDLRQDLFSFGKEVVLYFLGNVLHAHFKGLLQLGNDM